MSEEANLAGWDATVIVRRARCTRCDGMGIRRAPAVDTKGERVAGPGGRDECPDCAGYGIKLGVCRSLAGQAGA